MAGTSPAMTTGFYGDGTRRVGTPHACADPPHGGGALKPLLLPEEERDEALKRARTLKRLPLSSREVSDLFMLAMGAYTPLAGFMGAADWRGACLDMRLESGLFWPLPITLSCRRGRSASASATRWR